VETIILSKTYGGAIDGNSSRLQRDLLVIDYQLLNKNVSNCKGMPLYSTCTALHLGFVDAPLGLTFSCYSPK
jgi:hypothetical protein